MVQVLLRTTLCVAIIILTISLFIDSSMGCLRTEDIDQEQQWACWNLSRPGYFSPDLCCSELTCECDENGNYSSNARFGRDCKCVTTSKFVIEYYARIADQQQRRELNVTESTQD